MSIEIDFRHLYEISFVYMRFCGPMPHAMIIYKSSDAKKTWQPYQYYANNCIQQFGIEPDRALTRLNEDEPLCTEEPNSPLQLNLGTSISFNVLHNRPSSRNEELNPILLVRVLLFFWLIITEHLELANGGGNQDWADNARIMAGIGECGEYDAHWRASIRHFWY